MEGVITFIIGLIFIFFTILILQKLTNDIDDLRPKKEKEKNKYFEFIVAIYSFFLEIINPILDIVKKILIFLLKIFLTILGIALIIAGVVLTYYWLIFVFGSTVAVVIILIFCWECFFLPLLLSMFGLSVISLSWSEI